MAEQCHDGYALYGLDVDSGAGGSVAATLKIQPTLSPCPADVPMPKFQVTGRAGKPDNEWVSNKDPQLLKDYKAALVANVQTLLHAAAKVLLQVPARTLPVAELYLDLSLEVTAFMESPRIWLSDVVELFLDDFDTKQVHGKFFVTYLHAYIPEGFSMSTESKLVSL
eukprot:TRINITY_DN71390_c0_g1_i2.p1 TRINITY_DN71390_c0_g1~~TRINITY_DN71390_c0_g1_i2.p1  ORF type:complete len:167 (-),score=32.56 TRINITY_DN71390_c0_g1_i2:383-883(-)